MVKTCNLQPIADFAKAKLDGFEGDLTTEAARVRLSTSLQPSSCSKDVNFAEPASNP